MNADKKYASCSTCWLRNSCLPVGRTSAEWLRLDDLVVSRRRIRRKEALFRSGDRLSAIYAIRSGVFKLSMTAEDGREQVSAFQRVGEIVGLDGISREQHVSDAVALEDSVVCVMPLDRVEDLAREIPLFQRRMFQVMSQEIVREQNMMLLLGNPRAAERVAGFLLDLVESQQGAAAYPDCELRMTRQEIAGYLALTIETVSRTLWKFAADGLIEISKKNVRILDADALRSLVNTRSRSGAGCDESLAKMCAS